MWARHLLECPNKNCIYIGRNWDPKRGDLPKVTQSLLPHPLCPLIFLWYPSFLVMMICFEVRVNLPFKKCEQWFIPFNVANGRNKMVMRRQHMLSEWLLTKMHIKPDLITSIRDFSWTLSRGFLGIYLMDVAGSAAKDKELSLKCPTRQKCYQLQIWESLQCL